MTERDFKLVAQARSMQSMDWYLIDELIEKAETSEAKDRLQSIQCHKYRQEEALARCD